MTAMAAVHHLGLEIFQANCHDDDRKGDVQWCFFLDTLYITIQDGKHSTTNLEDVDFENVGEN